MGLVFTVLYIYNVFWFFGKVVKIARRKRKLKLHDNFFVKSHQNLSIYILESFHSYEETDRRIDQILICSRQSYQRV